MNILIISFEFPPKPGGIGAYAYHLSHELSRSDHDITTVVAYPDMDGQTFQYFADKQPFRLIHFKKYNYRFYSVLLGLNFFREIVKKHQIELIIIVYYKAGIVGYLCRKLYKIPYFIVGHGSEFLSVNMLHDFLIKMTYSGSDVIIPNSRYTESLMIKSGIKGNKVVIIHPGADDSLYHYAGDKRKHATKIILLTVGALSIRKGHRYVINAINLLRQKYPYIEYWIVGKGKQKTNLERQISELGLEKHVKLIGYVETDKLPDIYRNADIFILNSVSDDPSQIEGFGIVVIEANLMKLPVVASKHSGTEDAVEQGVNGLLVEPTDEREIAEVIDGLISNKELYTRLSKEGYLRAKNMFSWRVMADKYEQLIRAFSSSSI